MRQVLRVLQQQQQQLQLAQKTMLTPLEWVPPRMPMPMQALMPRWVAMVRATLA